MRTGMRRAAAVAAIAAVLAGCGSGGSAGTAGQGTVAAATTVPALKLTAQQLCVSVVDNWLQMSVNATQEGYPLGVDPTKLMERYGASSAIYMTFMQLNGLLVSHIANYGVSGAYQSVTGQTRQTCKEYGA